MIGYKLQAVKNDTVPVWFGVFFLECQNQCPHISSFCSYINLTGLPIFGFPGAKLPEIQKTSENSLNVFRKYRWS